jgi:hypothetical protein
MSLPGVPSAVGVFFDASETSKARPFAPLLLTNCAVNWAVNPDVVSGFV